MRQGKHVDDMTNKWLSQTPSPLRIPIFYKLTKIHMLILVGRPLISGCDGPAGKISSFVETLPQTMAQLQQSHMRDATAFLNFIEKTKVGKDTILVSMNVSSLYTNIPQEEGTNILCEAYEKLNDHNAPIPTHYLREMLGLIFQRKFVLIQWGELPWPKRKWAMSFANISMAKIETKSIQQCETRPREWKHYIDDVFSLWD